MYMNHCSSIFGNKLCILNQSVLVMYTILPFVINLKTVLMFMDGRMPVVTLEMR